MAQAYPTLQAVGTAVGGTTGISVSWPSHQADDIGILCVETHNTDSDVTISGWTHVTWSPAVQTGTKLNVLWKRATSSSEGSVSVPDTGDHQYGVIFTVRGVPAGLATPYLAAGAVGTDVSSYPNLPGVTSPQARFLMVSIISRDDDDATAHFSNWDLGGPISGGTEVFDAGTTSGTGGGLGIAWANVYDSGNTYGGSVQSNASASYAAIALAFGAQPTDCPWLVCESASASTINTTFNVTVPSNIQAGDLALLVVEQSGNDTAVTATGYSHISGSPYYDLNTTAGSLVSVMYRVLDGTETVASISAPADHAVARLFIFRNAAIDTAAVQRKTMASGTGTAPAVTTATDDELIFLVCSRPNDNTGYYFSDWTNANLTGLEANPYYEGSTASGNGGGFGTTTGYKATAGSTGTSTVSISVSVTDVAYTIALKFSGASNGMFWANNA